MDVRTYLRSLALVCVAAAVVRAASGKSAAKKYIDFLCSLCVICAIIIPVAQELSGFDVEDISDLFEEDISEYGQENYEEIYNSYILEGRALEAEEFLEKGLSETLGTGVEDVRVMLVTDASAESPTVIEVVAQIGKAAYNTDPELVKSYLEEQTGVMCRIIY